MAELQDDALLLLRAERQTAQDEAKKDAELITTGGHFLRLTQQPGWPVLVHKLQMLRYEIAESVLIGKDVSLDYAKGQADGVQKVMDLVQNGIQAAQEALQRAQEAQVGKRVRREVLGESSGLVGD